MDPISGGILVVLACLIAAIVLGVGFAVALCRGARKARRERADASELTIGVIAERSLIRQSGRVGNRVSAAITVAALLIVGGTTAVAHHLRGDVISCAGVGLNGPHAASSDAALAAFLHEVGQSATDWKRVDHNNTSNVDPESYTYAPKNGVVQHGYFRIYVSHRGHVWLADEAC